MAYQYENAKLVCKNETSKSTSSLSIVDLVKTHGSPLYVYDIDDVLSRVKLLTQSFDRPIEIHYAVKANFHPYLLRVLSEQGVGADVVSGGELNWAIEHGHQPEHIVFSGVGKSKEEIRLALEKSIAQINVESPAELRRIAKLAKELNKKAPVAFRMNPDVSAQTHPYIQTGFRENKFGMDLSFLDELKLILKDNPESLDLKGLTLHIGSQIRDLTALRDAVLKTKSVWHMLVADGYKLTTFDIGGGLGINYSDFPGEDEVELIREYGKTMSEALSDIPEAKVMLEPGRILVGRMGLLVGEVQYIKTTPYKNFAIINTGMHHLLRPSLYQAFHRILPLVLPQSDQSVAGDYVVYDVVGPICESSDVVGYDRRLPKLEEGDFLAVADAGAYGYSMASSYNLHAYPKQICIHNGVVKDLD